MDHPAATWRDPLPDAAEDTFWGSLSAQDRQALHEAGGIRTFARGEAVCQEGHVSGGVYLIYRGRVEVARNDPAGYRTVLARRGPGDIVGELSAVDGRPALATVTALERSLLLVVGAERFTGLCRTRPGVAWLVLRNVIIRLRLSDTERSQHRADVPQRTIRCLLGLAEATGHRRAGHTVELSLTQQELADLISSSLVSVTRALTELRRAGAVVTKRGRIAVRTDRLRALLAP